MSGNMLSFSLGINGKGAEEFKDKLKSVPEEVIAEVEKGLMEFAGMIQAESVKKTPLDTGELRSRAFSELIKSNNPDETTAVVGYEKFGLTYGKTESNMAGKYYAVPVHERMDVQHRIGQSKFLESTIKEKQSEMLPYLKEAYDRAMENLKQ